MPTLLIEHSSEHSQVFQDLTNSDSPYDRADEFPERSHLHHSGHRSLDLGRFGLMLESTGQTELDINLMSLLLLGEIVTHIVNLSPSDTLTQVNTLRLRC